jgi:hypothetical protein
MPHPERRRYLAPRKVWERPALAAAPVIRYQSLGLAENAQSVQHPS